MNRHPDVPVETHTDAADSHFDPSLCQWETDEQWQQCYDYYMDIQWDESRDVQERVDARLTLYGRLQVVRPYEEENSPWWSANTNPNSASYSKRHSVTPQPTAFTSSPRSDEGDTDH